MADSLTAFKNQVRALDLSVKSKNNCKNCKLCKTQLLSFLHCLYIVFFFFFFLLLLLLLLLLAQFNQFLLVKTRTIDTLIKLFIHTYHDLLQSEMKYPCTVTVRFCAFGYPVQRANSSPYSRLFKSPAIKTFACDFHERHFRVAIQMKMCSRCGSFLWKSNFIMNRAVHQLLQFSQKVALIFSKSC